MEFSFDARVVLVLEDNPTNRNRPKVKETMMSLYTSKNIDSEAYLTNGVLNENGSIAMSNVLTHGLVANILNAAHFGFRDKQEHLQHVIKELTRAVEAEAVSVVTGEGEFP